MSLDEAKEHLHMLADTVGNDIEPLLATPGCAPFAVAREVFSYVDYLGSLRYGRRTDRKMSVLAKRFISNYLGKVDSAYGVWGGVIYEMYRHGTIHNFEPQQVTVDGSTIYGWAAYAGKRTDVVVWAGSSIRETITHLQPLPKGPLTLLPISTSCLVQDLKEVIVAFENDLTANPSGLLPYWNRFASFIGSPRQITL